MTFEARQEIQDALLSYCRGIDRLDVASSALVETYVLAFHIERLVETTDEGDMLYTFNGRYIDRFDQRGDGWKIAKRTLRTDWSQIEPITSPMRGNWVPSGRTGSPDPLTD
jgi:hypothetical protein